jgi:predicted RNA binding protein YcfA (HicA-like mRNA interferase family)
MKRKYKVSEILRLLKDDGWWIERINGDHRQLRHNTKKGTVTVAGKLTETLKPKTQKSISEQSGIEL